MRKVLLFVVLFCSFLFASEHLSDWGYSGKNGPKFWGDLKQEYKMCKLGKNQSPVNLDRFVEADLKKLNIFYGGNASSIINNGHTIKIDTIGKNSIVLDGKTFILKQFHFHTPSENLINGKRFPMEAHFVHESKDKELVVVAIMFKEGKKNSALKKIIEQFPKKINKKESLVEMFNPGELFPKKLDYYRFNGSLTTPPCSEGVRWIVLKNFVEASKEQLESMRKILGENARDVQPLNSRIILK